MGKNSQSDIHQTLEMEEELELGDDFEVKHHTTPRPMVWSSAEFRVSNPLERVNEKQLYLPNHLTTGELPHPFFWETVMDTIGTITARPLHEYRQTTSD